MASIYRRELTRENASFLPVWFLARPPRALYALGSAEAFEALGSCPSRALAVVGTREPYAFTARYLRRELMRLRDSGSIIVSGFARGVDRIAHEAALDARLPTIAILGSGLNITYPREHAALRERLLAQDGLLITEFSDDEPPRGHHFVLRNRLIAALSHAVLIAQAPESSGALITARYARELDRQCYAIPSFPSDPGARGSNQLLELRSAIEFWSIGSLRFSFPGLDIPGETEQAAPVATRAERALLATIERRCHEFGSVTRFEIADLAATCGIARSDAHETLDQLVRLELVIERNGELRVNETC